MVARSCRLRARASASGLLIVVPLVMIAAAGAGARPCRNAGQRDLLEAGRRAARAEGRSSRAGRCAPRGTSFTAPSTKRETPCEYRFTITKNGVDVPVRFAECVVPDTFRDVPGADVGVTVEGELQADNTFEATSVLAKCPSKYETKARGAKGESMPGSAGDTPRGTM